MLLEMQRLSGTCQMHCKRDGKIREKIFTSGLSKWTIAIDWQSWASMFFANYVKILQAVVPLL